MSQIDKNDMDMPYTDSLSGIEFFSYEQEVWCRRRDGSVMRITESDVDIIRDITEMISAFYPEAYRALAREYSSCAANQPYFRYRMASRFIRCNFAPLDHVPDISAGCRCQFESVPCPLRGECPHDHVICRPSFAHGLTPAELRVLAPLWEGMGEADIAASLCLSVHTVHNHIRNAYARLGLRSKAEFIKYAAENNLFHGKV